MGAYLSILGDAHTGECSELPLCCEKKTPSRAVLGVLVFRREAGKLG